MLGITPIMLSIMSIANKYLNFGTHVKLSHNIIHTLPKLSWYQRKEGLQSENWKWLTEVEISNFRSFANVRLNESIKLANLYGFRISMEPTSPSLCIDLNECDLFDGICRANSFCVNSLGSFYCVCDVGYSGMEICEGGCLV